MVATCWLNNTRALYGAATHLANAHGRPACGARVEVESLETDPDGEVVDVTCVRCLRILARRP